MTNSDRITVVGAGAMGSIFGCALADAGCDVSFLDISKNLVERIRDRGLLLVRDGEEHLVRVRASDRALDIGISDVVLICVKCYDTEAAALGIGPLVGDDTIVVSLQNGWGNGEVLARFFDPVRLVVGVTYNSGTLLGPAHVAHTAEAPTYLGPYDGGGLEPAERFGAILARAGLSAHVTEQIRDEIWKKLVLNAATLPTAALTGLTARALGEVEEMRSLVSGLLRETVAVAQAVGCAVDLDERLAATDAILAAAGTAKASMLQDVEAGRATELEVITGAVVRAAAASGVDAPLNTALYALMKGVEAARGGQAVAR